MDRTEELEDQVRRLSRTVEEMRAQMARLEGREPDAKAGTTRSNRRGFLRLGAAAAASAVGWMAVRAVPASAANGGTFTLGQANLAEAATTITGDGTSGAPTEVLGVAANGTTWVQGTTGSFAGPLQGLGVGAAAGTAVVDGVDGWAGGTAGAGVYGLTDTGYGVIGESNQGIGLYARTSGRLRQDGPFAGTPAHTPNAFEQVRDSSGVLWIHSLGSGAGLSVWRRVNSPRVDAADGSGNAFKPLRLVDTRLGFGGPAGNGSIRDYLAAGAGTGLSSIPTDAVALLGNITVVAGASGGFMSIHPGGSGYNPATDPATFNFGPHAIVSNAYFSGLGTGAKLGQIEVYVGVSGSSPANFIIDITGYVQ